MIKNVSKFFLPFLSQKRAFKKFFVRGACGSDFLSYFLLASFILLTGFIDRGKYCFFVGYCRVALATGA